jgi:hypothetical protein
MKRHCILKKNLFSYCISLSANAKYTFIFQNKAKMFSFYSNDPIYRKEEFTEFSELIYEDVNRTGHFNSI